MTDKPSKITARSPSVQLGATEWLYLLGLLFLSTGIAIEFSPVWALIICGGLLIATAYFNATQPGE